MRMSATQIGGDSGSKVAANGGNASDLGFMNQCHSLRGTASVEEDGLRGFYRGIVLTSVGAIPTRELSLGLTR